MNSELLQEIFDEQVEEMISLIDDQIKALQRSHSGEQIVSYTTTRIITRGRLN
jgi:hypothetical protein